jgi:hypothetical protein
MELEFSKPVFVLPSDTLQKPEEQSNYVSHDASYIMNNFVFYSTILSCTHGVSVKSTWTCHGDEHSTHQVSEDR